MIQGPERRPVLGVFAGGGVKVAALVGALKEAERYIRLVGWGGTSAGAIVAGLLACGYEADELETLLNEASFDRIFKVSPLRVALIPYYRAAIDPGPLLEWLRGSIRKKFPKKARVTFKDLPEQYPLKIVTANVTAQEIKIHSRATDANEEIAQAVLASCSFPLVFPAFRHGTDELVDGGIFSNFPMWLFDDEREAHHEATPVLGFTLVPDRRIPGRTSFLEHLHSVFESVLAAQDRVQEKYLDIPRSSNVIRIKIPPTGTFDSKVNRAQLVLTGRDAAMEYFRTATVNYGEPIAAPAAWDPSIVATMVKQAQFNEALSSIARQHVLNGGVARDDGLSSRRVLVRYYVDLMAAATDHNKLEMLATILANRIETLTSFDRIIGIKKGNILLAYEVARQLKKPISVFKTDMSYKMGAPFDGVINRGERVLVVDDIASDSSILLTALRQLNLLRARVDGVATLLERPEGDARDALWRIRNCPLHSVCKVDDAALHRLIYEHATFSTDGWDPSVAHV